MKDHALSQDLEFLSKENQGKYKVERNEIISEYQGRLPFNVLVADPQEVWDSLMARKEIWLLG